jgi:hypothetical protein
MEGEAMEQKGGKHTHGGILIRGATGALWFMRDDDTAPHELKDPELVRRITGFIGKEPEEQQLGFPLSDEAIEALSAAYGPLIGVVHYRALRLPG